MLLCSSLTYNAKEIRMLLKEDQDPNTNEKWTVEWIVIDPASFTGNCPQCHIGAYFYFWYLIIYFIYLL